MAEPKRRKVGVSIKGSALLDAVNAIKARSGDEAYQKLVGMLDEEGQEIFRGPLLADDWFPLDAFLRFVEVDLRETAGGDAQALVERSERIVDKQLQGIYRLFVRFGSPEFVLKRISLVHMTYFNGVHLEIVSLRPGRAAIRYTGFEPEHRLIGYSIIGFFRKALEISGAKDVQVGFQSPIGGAQGYAELVATWS